MEEVTVTMNREEATAFREYREHQDNIQLLFKSGFFNVRNADVIISLDQNGVINGIKRHDVLFARKIKLSPA